MLTQRITAEMLTARGEGLSSESANDALRCLAEGGFDVALVDF